MEIRDPYPPQAVRQTETPVTVGEWMLTMLLMIIPVVNIVMLFVWGFGGNTTPSKANWAKASLLWTVICFAIGIVIAVLFAGAFLAGSLL